MCTVSYIRFSWNPVLIFKSIGIGRLIACPHHYPFEKRLVTEDNESWDRLARDGSTQWSLRCSCMKGRMCWPHLDEPSKWDSLVSQSLSKCSSCILGTTIGWSHLKLISWKKLHFACKPEFSLIQVPSQTFCNILDATWNKWIISRTQVLEESCKADANEKM